MKRSIKWKFTFTFIIVIVCCIGSIFIFNKLFLEKLYINDKKEIIKKSYYALENGITEAYSMGYNLSDLFKKRRSTNDETAESSLTRFIRELQEIYGVTTVLMDSENKVYSLFQNNSMFERRIKNYIFNDAANDNLKIIEKTDKYTIIISKPTREIISRQGVASGGPSEYYESKGPSVRPNSEGNRYRPANNIVRNSDLECFGFLSDDSTAFFLTIPVGSIREPIELFNRVLIIISICAIIIGSIAIYLISNKLVSPLLKLSELSKKMSKLEFENKYEGNSQDEIGVLGNSMNDLSLKLEKSIRELKNANIKLKQDLEKKEQLDLMRQEFVANVSHELKTPISLIEGYAEGLEIEGIADSKEQRDYYISVIKDEASKMNSIVRDLLDLSALERGMEDLEIERINLKEIVDSVSKNFAIKIKDKDIKLKNTISADVFVWTDGYKLEEVIRNYLSNAINHVDSNGIVEINGKQIDDTKYRIGVSNSGVQLSDDDRVKVWEKFYKVDKAHTREYGGTGLGLSIVKAIAEQLKTSFGCNNVDINGHTGVEFYFDLNLK